MNWKSLLLVIVTFSLSHALSGAEADDQESAHVVNVQSNSSKKAPRVQRKFFGSFIGVSLGSVQQGASFDDSLVEIFIDAKGLRRIDGRGDLRIETTYSSEWLMSARESKVLSGWLGSPWIDPDIYLAIRQEKGGDLAASILKFRKWYSPVKMIEAFRRLFRKKIPRIDIVEFLGEGMPLPLAVFAKRDSSGKWRLHLKSIYDEARKAQNPADENQDHNWLQPVNVEEDLRVLRTEKSLNVLMAVIRRAESNLWTGSAKEVQDRLSLFRYAILESENLDLVRIALENTHISVRVGAIVPILVTAIEESVARIQKHGFNALDILILDAAIGGAVIQLHEAVGQHGVNAKAYKEFGLLDVTEILKKKDGKISVEESKLIAALTRTKNRGARNYTREHISSLRSILQKALTIDLVPENTKANIVRGLRDYPDPYCAEGLAGLGTAEHSGNP